MTDPRNETADPPMTEPAARDDAAAFLRKHGMYYEDYDMERILCILRAAMEEDLRAGASSGRMIPCFTGDYRAPSGDVCISVLDIGGSNVRCAVLTIGPKGLCQIQNRLSFPTPGTDRPTDTARFFGQIVEKCRENLTFNEIGICFSFAALPQKGRDAVILAGGKQLQVPDMPGKKVGESFRAALAVHGLLHSQRITVINDTAAAAFGGVMAEAGAFSSYIGFIYGTGMNVCYREMSGDWINTEAGTYTCVPAGDLDDAFDSTLIDPGCDRLEKMVSGGYQGGLMTCIFRAALSERVILSGLPDTALTTRDISAFSNEPYGLNRIARACTNDRDRAVIAAVCDFMTKRSARICAAVITAALLRTGTGTSPERPVWITAEGSTYLKQKGFREEMDACMEQLAVQRHGLHLKTGNVPDAILKGTAAASQAQGTALRLK